MQPTAGGLRVRGGRPLGLPSVDSGVVEGHTDRGRHAAPVSSRFPEAGEQLTNICTCQKVASALRPYVWTQRPASVLALPPSESLSSCLKACGDCKQQSALCSRDLPGHITTCCSPDQVNVFACVSAQGQMYGYLYAGVEFDPLRL